MPNLTRRRSFIGIALRTFAPQLALASRLAAPSSNKLITSIKSSHCTQSRFIMDFSSEKGREEVREWYKHQGRNTRFNLLEYRKVKEGRVKHEFIVVRLNSTTLCRFDRRPHNSERGHVLRDEGVPAEDSAHVLSCFETEYKELMLKTDVLLTVKLPDGEDMSLILDVCEGIQTHAKSASYNLMRYNCYFFSWTIVAAVSRRTYNWEAAALSKAEWDKILQISLTHISPTSSQNEGGRVSAPLQRLKIGPWLGRIAAKLHVRPQEKLSSLATTPEITGFLAALLSQYSESHDTIHEVLRRLLLRSQLGPSLNAELRRIEDCGFSSLMLQAVRETIKVGAGIWRPHEWYHYELQAAEEACAAIISRKDIQEGPISISWETAWRTAWDKKHIFFVNGCGEDYRKSCYKDFGNSETIRDKAMKEWKTVWDEIEKVAAQYTKIATTAVMTTMLEELTDMAPDQLMFGDSIQCLNALDKAASPPSLQQFLRTRMQDHFELVDRFGFGSFQELITTAEEAMCEIWVTSLNIIESNRYR